MRVGKRSFDISLSLQALRRRATYISFYKIFIACQFAFLLSSYCWLQEAKKSIILKERLPCRGD
jgi:hypothetical protein